MNNDIIRIVSRKLYCKEKNISTFGKYSIRYVISGIVADDYSIELWNEAVFAITKNKTVFDSPKDAKSYLLTL